MFETKNSKVYGIRKYLSNMGFNEDDHEEICDIFMFMVKNEKESSWNAKGRIIQESFDEFTKFIKTSKYVETTFERTPLKNKDQKRKG